MGVIVRGTAQAWQGLHAQRTLSIPLKAVKEQVPCPAQHWGTMATFQILGL